eukprot:g2601.t1
MGNSNSYRQDIYESESRLFGYGFEWYQSVKGKKKKTEEEEKTPLKFEDVSTRNGRSIHTVSIERREGDKAGNDYGPLVLLHGYGGGVGMFYSILPQLASRWHGAVYALDSPGCGLSTREPWSKCTDRVATESYMVDEIEAWRKSVGIESMTLLGHSVGGYLACCYAEKYPSRINRLVLASPVGVPEEPKDWNQKVEKFNWKFRLAIQFWNWGFSPFTVVRNAPNGKSLVDGYVKRRYKEKPWIDRGLLANYIHSNVSGPRSVGDYCHSALLKPGAWAKNPLCHRIPSLRMKGSVTFLYGTRDWMGSEHAVALKKSMRRGEAVDAEGIRLDLDGDAAATDEESASKRAAENDDTSEAAGVRTMCSDRIRVRIVPRAGHNLQIDNPIGFVETMMSEIEEEEERKEKGGLLTSATKGRL